ncbi:MAG: GNAT family N-acetyltransferase, partial [Bacteroidales bacterium]|nr:GNAT family N-acetyltransferase [Bacteroidales bacterium]
KPSGLPPVVPVIKLNMLGVDKSLQKQGIGKKLLQDALLKVVDISKIAGCKGLYLLAEKDAVSFYEKLGFVALKHTVPLPMFLNIEEILESVNGTD